jgi:DNA-binding response OmpR family regulator
MPGMDGITVCEKLRSSEITRHIPIVILSGVADVDQRIKVFLTGADDFVTKPFRIKELAARVESKLRRVREVEEGMLQPDRSPEKITCGNLTLDSSKIEVSINGKVVPLSVLEFNLLRFIVVNADRVISRETILQNVWKDAVVTDRTVDTHIACIRKKLKDFDHVISTIYGAGYILKPNATTEPPLQT